MSRFSDHAAYIAAAAEELQPVLAHLHAVLAGALPDLEEVIRYDMPGFASGNVIIAGYGAFSKQCGLYVSKGAILAHSSEIAAAGLKASKTGVTFSPKKPIPDALVIALACASRDELGQ